MSYVSPASCFLTVKPGRREGREEGANGCWGSGLGLRAEVPARRGAQPAARENPAVPQRAAALRATPALAPRPPCSALKLSLFPVKYHLSNSKECEGTSWCSPPRAE